MNVKIKKLNPKAVIPKYAKQGDAGLDLTAVDITASEDGYLEYDTGLSVEIPEGYVGLLFPRSSVSKTNLFLTNAVGVIDSSYRGSIRLRFKPISCGKGCNSKCTCYPMHAAACYKVGDRVGQLIIMPFPSVEFVEVDELSETERGDGGYGSTGE